jgi:hypothetical protein
LYVEDVLEVDNDIYVGDDLTVEDAVKFPDVYNTSIGGGRDVYISNLGILGYQSSSRRYKENIQTLNNCEWFYNLRPVSFNYKTDSLKSNQYGLIAEEVEQVNDKLVFYNQKGEVESVHYDQLTPILITGCAGAKKVD